MRPSPSTLARGNRGGDRTGSFLTFVDASKEEMPAVRHVAKVLAKLHREVWDLTWETFGEDEQQVAAVRRLFGALLGIVEMWRAQPK